MIMPIALFADEAAHYGHPLPVEGFLEQIDGSKTNTGFSPRAAEEDNLTCFKTDTCQI